jgi:hypothetical protein
VSGFANRFGLRFHHFGLAVPDPDVVRHFNRQMIDEAVG